MENLESNYSHINGWGIDADPENEPTYPMKKYTGDDHNRLNYQRPELQAVNEEVLHSNERPNLPAVFGTPLPPSGVSGVIRRFAFKFSEGNWTHWLSLILADRVNAIEGIIDDVKGGHFPNVLSERGFKAMWKHNPKLVVRKVATGVALGFAVYALMNRKSKKKNKYVAKNGYRPAYSHSGKHGKSFS